MVQIVEIRHKFPTFQYAGHPVDITVKTDCPSHAVRASEQAIVYFARENDHRGTAFVVGWRPWAAEFEWRVEHRKEVRKGRSYRNLGGLLLGIIRLKRK